MVVLCFSARCLKLLWWLLAASLVVVCASMAAVCASLVDVCASMVGVCVLVRCLFVHLWGVFVVL